MKNEWQVRQMNDSDIEQVAKISKQQFKAESVKSEEIWRSHTTQRHWNCLVATDELEQIVGYLFYVVAENSIFIQEIAVEESHKRQGAGSLLVKALRKTYRKRKIATLIHDSHLPMHLFLKSVGMTAIAVRKVNGEDFYEFNQREVRC